MTAPSDERSQVMVNGGATGGSAERADRPRRGRRVFVVAAGVLAVAAGGGAGAFAFVTNGDGRPAGQRTASPTATAEITRGDLVDTESADGKLTYADERELPAAASGVVTWLPAEGATVTRGKPLL